MNDGRQPEDHGSSQRGRSLYIVDDFGWLFIPVFIGIAVAVLFPLFSRARNTALESACRGNLAKLGAAVLMYCEKNDGYFPPPETWESAVRPYAGDDKLFVCPVSGRKHSYTMNPRLTGLRLSDIESPGKTVMLSEPFVVVEASGSVPAGECPPHDDLYHACFVDGSVKGVEAKPRPDNSKPPSE